MRVNRLTPYILPLLILAIANSASASSPDSWRKHRQEVIARCTQASGLPNPQPAGEIVSFGDDIGYDALIIQGNYPQPHMHNRVRKVLCLFNRRTHQASTSQANQIIQKQPE